MRILVALGCAVISGLLLGLSLPPIGWGWPIAFALVPLFASLIGTRIVLGVVAGLLTAATPAVLLANGVLPVPHPSQGEPNWIYAGYLLFGALLAVTSAFVSVRKELSARRLLVNAAITVVAE